MLSQHELPDDWWSDLLGCVKVVFYSTGQQRNEPCAVGVGARLAVACRCFVGACG